MEEMLMILPGVLAARRSCTKRREVRNGPVRSLPISRSHCAVLMSATLTPDWFRPAELTSTVGQAQLGSSRGRRRPRRRLSSLTSAWTVTALRPAAVDGRGGGVRQAPGP